VEQTLRKLNVKYSQVKFIKFEDRFQIEYEVRGSEEAHESLKRYFADQPFILHFEN